MRKPATHSRRYDGPSITPSRLFVARRRRHRRHGAGEGEGELGATEGKAGPVACRGRRRRCRLDARGESRHTKGTHYQRTAIDY